MSQNQQKKTRFSAAKPSSASSTGKFTISCRKPSLKLKKNTYTLLFQEETSKGEDYWNINGQAKTRHGFSG